MRKNRAKFHVNFTGAVLLATFVSTGGHADTFGTGANQFTIDFAEIGNPGNPGDTNHGGYGAVDYGYRIGKHEITIDQYIKANTADSRIDNGSTTDPSHWNDGTRTVGINAPVSKIGILQMFKFCNWLTSGNAHKGVYKFDSAGNYVSRNRAAAIETYGTAYALPLEDEWYKAAFYRPINDGTYSDYSSGLDEIPIHGTSAGWNYASETAPNYVIGDPNYMWPVGSGAVEQNGTYDMIGNVTEYMLGLDNNSTLTAMTRGGNAFFLYRQCWAGWRSASAPPSLWKYDNGERDFGFRVVSIPLETSPSALWFADYGLTGDDIDWYADLDGDGMQNLLEYALGGDPTLIDNNEVRPDRITVSRDPVEGRVIDYVYRRRIDADERGLSYWLVLKSDLKDPWVADTNRYDVVGIGPIDEEFEAVTNRISNIFGRQFMRLRVSVEE
jgi:formylglycine-generating enzyme required for sulfatase activity